MHAFVHRMQSYRLNLCTLHCYTININTIVLWHYSVMVKAIDLQAVGRVFDSWLFHFHVTTVGKLFTHMCLCHQSV